MGKEINLKITVNDKDISFLPESTMDAFNLGQIFQKIGSGNIQATGIVDGPQEINSITVSIEQVIKILTA